MAGLFDLHLTADICGEKPNVRYGPKADSCSLFDHLICLAKRDSGTEKPSALAILRLIAMVGVLYGRGQRLLFDLQQGKGCANYEDDANDDPRGHRFIEKQRSKNDGVNRFQCHETAARVG